MPAAPPPARPPLRVLVLGAVVAGLPADGVYPIDKLSACELRAPERCVPSLPEVNLGAGGAREALLLDVDAVLIGQGHPLDAPAANLLRTRFQPTSHAGPQRIHLRR